MDKNSKNYQDWLLKAENDLKAATAILRYYEVYTVIKEKLVSSQ